MKKLDLEQMGVQEMDAVEVKETEGGIIGLLVAYVIQAALVGSLAAGLYASAKSGYESVQ